ncbi:MAG: CoA transferase, partial [Chloroflexi bacterium]|nr:CoA transferase [Chloroflexota bacterium]
HLHGAGHDAGPEAQGDRATPELLDGDTRLDHGLAEFTDQRLEPLGIASEQVESIAASGVEASDFLGDGRIRTGDEVEHAFNVLRRFIKAHTADEIYHGAQQRRFPWGVIRSPDETLDDPHLWERGFFERVEHPELGESYIYPGRPYILNKTPWRTRRAPLVGEHNRKVYVDDLGLTEDEVERLQQDGVI